jgi:hypothetical protein
MRKLASVLIAVARQLRDDQSRKGDGQDKTP